MFLRSRKHIAKDGSLSISFQILESHWDTDKKRSIAHVIKNLGTCKIYKYDAERMTQTEYYRLIGAKYKKFLENVKSELLDFPNGAFFFSRVKNIIKNHDGYYMRFN